MCTTLSVYRQLTDAIIQLANLPDGRERVRAILGRHQVARASELPAWRWEEVLVEVEAAVDRHRGTAPQ
jgi:hypothetical protein